VNSQGVFARPPDGVTFILALLIVLVSVEVGYRRARYKQSRSEREDGQEKEAPGGRDGRDFSEADGQPINLTGSCRE
jgi:hypothetical protein